MITVLEHGALKINCPECRARLQYEQEDIQMDENNLNLYRSLEHHTPDFVL